MSDQDAGEGSDLSAVAPDAPTSTRVTVQVLDNQGGSGSGLEVGLPVIFNDAAGNLIGPGGVTDKNGRYAQDGIPAGASASVLVNGGESDPVLQTVYSIQPGTTVIFTDFVGGGSSVTTALVTLANLPTTVGPEDLVTVAIGNCVGNAFPRDPTVAQIGIAPFCLQNDGRFTVYATIVDPVQGLVADALATDVPISSSLTLVTLSTWRMASAGGVKLNFFGFAAPFLDASEGAPPSARLSLERKGVAYRPFLRNAGEIGDADILGIDAQFPDDLPLAAGGAGFRIDINAPLLTPAGLVTLSHAERRQAIDDVLWFDAGAITKDAVDFSASLDLSAPTRPRITWTNHTGSTLNTIVALTQWQDPTIPGVLFGWIANAPYTAKAARMPLLPASFGRFSFPTTGKVSTPNLTAIEDSRHPTYDEFVTHENPFASLTAFKGSRRRLLLRNAPTNPSTIPPTMSLVLDDLRDRDR